jgi:glycosyltransferase involved in cell wall biosynthesis
MPWTCLQLGSREHYAVPAALQAAGALERLITDVWLGRHTASWLRQCLPALASRRTSAIPDRKVEAWTIQRLAFDAKRKLARSSEWTTIIERNAAFGAWAAKQMHMAGSSVLFSYSYTAFHPFQQFRGLKVLGQIDPGPREEEVVAHAAKSYERLALPESLPPPAYWKLWRREIDLADRIVVNSAWSSLLLAQAGVPREKMVEVPLVYAPKARSGEHGAKGKENSPGVSISACQNVSVSRSGPRLQALFLGSVILRKGVGQLFDAIRMLKSEPVDFTFAGPVGVRVPDDIRSMPNVRFLGPVDRGTAEHLYRESDVFLFPTLSDGFGLTQLEALGHGLPIISSLHCGQVVEHGISGLILPEVTPTAIAEGIMELVRDRDLLAQLKSGARVPDKCHPRHLAPALLALEGKEKKLKG